MRIILYVGESGWDWSNSVNAVDWERANKVTQWLVHRVLEQYGDVEVATRGVYGHVVECYDETGNPDPDLEESLSKIVQEMLGLFLENQDFWLRVPIPWEPYSSYEYSMFLHLKSMGGIWLIEPHDDQARQGLYALTDLTEEAWVGEVAQVSPDAFPAVRVGDYVVCDGIGAPVRFYRLD